MPELLCGVDVGGTKLAAGLVSPEGEVRRFMTRHDHVDATEGRVMDIIAELVGELCRAEGVPPAELGGIGVGMAGHMRSRDGVVLTTSNLPGFKEYPLTRELKARLPAAKISLENDANCQAWAEFRFGAGRNYDDMVFVTVSTGIGSGIILNRRLVRGITGTAGEIGHSIVLPDSDLTCTCGNNGCFMALASTINLETLARKKSRRLKTKIFADEAAAAGNNGAKGGPGASETQRIDGRRIYGYACEGDPVALEIVDEYAEYLGIMLYNIFQIFNPPVIVLGGGLMNWELGYFDKMRRKFHSLAKDMLYDPLEIVKATVGDASGVIGAATLLLES